VTNLDAISAQVAGLRREWQTEPRWAGVRRRYEAADVIRLRGPVIEEHTLARLGAARLWELLRVEDAVWALGAGSGEQAVPLVRAGLQALYVAGEQAPRLVRQVNDALLGAARAEWAESLPRPAATGRNWLAPVVAGAAGGGGLLDAFGLMKAMIAAGAAGVYFADQLAPEGGGQPDGKVLVPTAEHIQTLTAARLAADACGVPVLVMARTHARAATLITSDADARDREFITGAQTPEGRYRVRNGLEPGIARGLAYAPYCDLLWLETPAPDLDEARRFAEAITDQYPDQMLAYDCSPWHGGPAGRDADAKFRKELAAMGYRFQFAARAPGRTAPRRQREAGAGSFDWVTQAITPGTQAFAGAGAAGSGQFAVPLD
jgi:isocitrate lyase